MLFFMMFVLEKRDKYIFNWLDLIDNLNLYKIYFFCFNIFMDSVIK